MKRTRSDVDEVGSLASATTDSSPFALNVQHHQNQLSTSQQLLIEELCRCHFAARIRSEMTGIFLREAVATLHLSQSPPADAIDGLFVAFVFETLSVASTGGATTNGMSSSLDRAHMNQSMERGWVHSAMDEGEEVEITAQGESLSSRHTNQEVPSDTFDAQSSSTAVAPSPFCRGTIRRFAFDARGPVAWVAVSAPTNRSGEHGIHQPNQVKEEVDNTPTLQQPLKETEEESHPIASLRLVNPKPLYRDVMLPSGEVIEPHRAPRSVYTLSLSALCEMDKVKRAATFKAKRLAAWRIADGATKVAWHHRAAFAELMQRLRAHCDADPDVRDRGGRRTELGRLPVVTAHLDHVEEQPSRSVEVVCDPRKKRDAVSLRLDASVSWLRSALGAGDLFDTATSSLLLPTTFSLHSKRVNELRSRFHARYSSGDLVTSSGTLEECLARVLLRYLGVTGCAPRNEDGWQAAVPRSVFALMTELLGIDTECFASPLNCALPRFCSAFPDTDGPFGSIGSFFEQSFGHGGFYEANPPFDHDVIRTAFDHALDALERLQRKCEGNGQDVPPLAFLFVVPFSDRADGVHVRERVEASPFKRAAVTLRPEEAPYVVGYQHEQGDEATFVNSGCSTRLLLIANDAALNSWNSSSRRAGVFCGDADVEERSGATHTPELLLKRISDAWKQVLVTR